MGSGLLPLATSERTGSLVIDPIMSNDDFRDDEGSSLGKSTSLALVAGRCAPIFLARPDSDRGSNLRQASEMAEDRPRGGRLAECEGSAGREGSADSFSSRASSAVGGKENLNAARFACSPSGITGSVLRYRRADPGRFSLSSRAKPKSKAASGDDDSCLPSESSLLRRSPLLRDVTGESPRTPGLWRP